MQGKRGGQKEIKNCLDAKGKIFAKIRKGIILDQDQEKKKENAVPILFATQQTSKNGIVKNILDTSDPEVALKVHLMVK